MDISLFYLIISILLSISVAGIHFTCIEQHPVFVCYLQTLSLAHVLQKLVCDLYAHGGKTMSTFKKMSAILLLVATLLLANSPTILAKTLEKVSLSGEGTSTGLPDLFTGTFSYSIPIDVPVGRKGMDPGLSLNYRSGMGNGEVGVGWELDLGAIQRPQPSSGAVSYSSDNFLYTSNGSTISLVSMGSGKYQAKIEGAFSKIQQLTASDSRPYWVVTDKVGRRFMFGQTAASRQDDPSNSANIYKWKLDKIVDTNGNYIAISYFKDNGQIYLSRIQYTGNKDFLPSNCVLFYWNQRTDVYQEPNIFKNNVTTNYVLGLIEISNSNNKIKGYLLGHAKSQSTNSLLTSVEVLTKNADGTSLQQTGLVISKMSYDQSGGETVDLLTKISNEISASTIITYSQTAVTGSSNLALNVSSVISDDGNGNASTSYYKYSGGYYYGPENDFRGFNWVEARGPVSSEGTQIRTKTYFHQGNFTEVGNYNIDDFRYSSIPSLDVSNVSIGYMKGKPYFSISTVVSGVHSGNEDISGEGQVISKKMTTYSPNLRPDSTYYFTPPIQTDTYRYDGDATYVQTRSAFEYDTIGNIITEKLQADLSAPDNDRTISRIFLSGTTSNITGLPATESVYQGIGINASNKIAERNYYYDDITTCNGSPTGSQAPIYGNLTRIVSWLNGGTNPEIRMAYDGSGNPACRRDAAGNITTFSYDTPSNTFPISMTTPLGKRTSTQYYGVNGVATDTGLYGQVKSFTDTNGTMTVKVYDSFGRQTKVTNPDNTWTSWSYNQFGTVGSQNVLTTLSTGAWSTSYFDGFGRTFRTATQGPESKSITIDTLYDSRGLVKSKSLPYISGQESPTHVLTNYDPIGRILQASQETSSSPIRSSACYDKNITVKIDSNNHRRREVHDNSGKLIKVEEYKGTYSSCSTEEGTPYATTTYQYDTLGNLRFVTNAKGKQGISGNQTEVRYDTLGRKTFINDPDMGSWYYEYDANGNLLKQTDAKGQIVNFSYDPLNRLQTKSYGSTVVLTNYYDDTVAGYFNDGHLTRMVDTSGQAVYNYDSMGRIQSADKTIGGTTYNLGFSYLNGLLSSITYPDGEKVSYTYDTGTLKGVTGFIGYSDFDAFNRPLSAAYGYGGASSRYNYYPDTKRLHTLTVTSPTQGLLIDNDYAYDSKGNISSITDNLGKVLPTNLSSETYNLGVGRAHWLSYTGSGRFFSYDNNGNITSDGLRSISYNYENMPVAVNATQFAYDGNNTRVTKSGPGTTTVYIDKLYECTNGTCRKYIFAGNTRVAMKSGNTVLYFHPDHQGGTSVVTDAAGNKIEDIAYYPFGDTRQDNGPFVANYRYTGQELDSETGLYNYNARLYDPELGRFMSPDSIVPDLSNPQSLNRYGYVNNNPTNFTDPTGHDPTMTFIIGETEVDPVLGATVAVTIVVADVIVANWDGITKGCDEAWNGVKNAAQSVWNSIFGGGGGNSSPPPPPPKSYVSSFNVVGSKYSSGSYAYVQNNPINRRDPRGLAWSDIPGALSQAFTGAANAIADIALNGPTAAKGLMALAASTEILPLALAAAPSATSICQLGMVAAGTPTAQNILNQAPDIISAYLPGSPTPTPVGYNNGLVSAILGQLGYEIK